MVLLDGDPEALVHLAESLVQLESPGAAPLAVHALPYATAHGGVELTVYAASCEEGLRRIDYSARRFVESGGGHNYLDAIAEEDARAIVGSGEYGPEWWARRQDAE